MVPTIMRISARGVAALRKNAGPPSNSPFRDIHLRTQPIRPPFCGDSIDVEVLGRTRPGRQLARHSLEVVDEGLFAVRYHRVVLSVLCADVTADGFSRL